MDDPKLDRIAAHMREYSGKSEIIKKQLLAQYGIDSIPYEEFYNIWDEGHYVSSEAQKAAYDFVSKTRFDPADTPVSSPPKLTQVQRAKLQAKRKLNRQNRKRARNS